MHLHLKYPEKYHAPIQKSSSINPAAIHWYNKIMLYACNEWGSISENLLSLSKIRMSILQFAEITGKFCLSKCRFWNNIALRGQVN